MAEKHAENEKPAPEEMSAEESRMLAQILEVAKPVLKQVSISSVAGFCTGVASKNVGKKLAYSLGLIFVGLQGLVHNGYIKVNWKKLETDTVETLDANADGVLDEKDVKIWSKKALQTLKHGAFSGGGFLAGLVAGLKWG